MKPSSVRSSTVRPATACARASEVGVYQIGEDQARSCTVAATIAGGAMPSSLAWMVVQRGVGTARARA